MIERPTRILNTGDSWDAASTGVFDVFYAKYFCPCGIPVMRAGEDIVIDGTQRYLLYDLPYIMGREEGGKKRDAE